MTMKRSIPFLLLLSLIAACDGEPYTENDVQAQRASLPRDEAPHFKNSLEWWYFTGHLYTADSSRRFGTEYVFFHTTPSAGQDFLILNYALTDPQQGAFYYDVDFNKLDQFLGDSLPLQLATQDGELSASLKGQMGNYDLSGQMEAHPVGMQLSTQPQKPVMLHDGTGYEDYAGLARAGYYSFPRLQAQGDIYLKGDTLPVHGTLWYDRQWDCLGVWSTKVGWDWFSVQLEDPREELMLYQLHSLPGDSIITLGGTYFTADSQQVELRPQHIEISAGQPWESPETGSVYPQCWNIQIDTLDLALEVQSELKPQELEMSYMLAMSVHYWEGMVKAKGRLRGEPVKGQGYVEMTNR